jgi:hypothetical protein
MFERKPRYLIDQHGELRRIYHRQGSFFPHFSRSLRPDQPNLSAVEVNGKWVLVEVDGNEQKKAVELGHASRRRQGLLVKTVSAVVFGVAAWNGPFGYRWIEPVKHRVVSAAGELGASSLVQHVSGGVAWLLLVLVCLLLAFYAARFSLSALKFLALEILYRLRFPFMKGAHADMLPVVPRKPGALLNLPWRADFANPWDAAAQMGAGGSVASRPAVTMPKHRRLTGA